MSNNLKILVQLDDKSVINNIHDKVMLQILEDVSKNNEPLELAKRVWNPKTKTAKFDVDDSVVLKLMYDIPLDK